MEKLNDKENMKDEVIISDLEKFEEIKTKFAEGGLENLHFLVDFDKTLTYETEKYPSIISVLRDGNHLTPDYAPRAHKLYNKYHPIEIDINTSKQEKIKAMKEWWKTHFELLIECKLNKKDIDDIVQSDIIKFRDGIKEMFEFLKQNKVPIVIMSAAGLGYESIAGILQKNGLLNNSIHVISNRFEWDKNGNAVAMKKPIIHSMNKSEIIVKDFSVFKQIENRKNVMLMGDSLDDLGMVDGFDYDNLLKVGFLNNKIDERLENYKKAFDLLILGDGSMNPVNQLLQEIYEHKTA
jgi:5'-nucleotidase